MSEPSAISPSVLRHQSIRYGPVSYTHLDVYKRQALEKVDTCPMEGFKMDEISKILEIDSEIEKVTVTLALGYRAEDDAFQKMKKVRKPNEKLFKFL